MKKKSEHNVYIKIKQNYIKLFRLIVFETDGLPELKIKDCATEYLLIKGNKVVPSQIESGQMIRFEQNLEFTYHKDGAMLQEVIPKNGKKEYQNPYGLNETWTPVDEIKEFQPFLNINIRNIFGYKLIETLEEERLSRKNYICENDVLFKKGCTYNVLIYLRNTSLPMCCYTTNDMYSDRICNIDSKLDVCIYIQKHRFTDFVNCPLNTFIFLDRAESIDLMRNTLFDKVFDKDFEYYIQESFGGFVFLHEELLKLLDLIDYLYICVLVGKRKIIHKPQFVKYVMEKVGSNMRLFNILPNRLKLCYLRKTYMNIRNSC